MLVLSSSADEVLDPYGPGTDYATEADARAALERAMQATAESGMESAIAIAALEPDYVPPSAASGSGLPAAIKGPGGTPHNQPISGWWVVGGVAVLGGIATFVFLKRRARSA